MFGIKDLVPVSESYSTYNDVTGWLTTPIRKQSFSSTSPRLE
jgi:hypothetical protein